MKHRFLKAGVGDDRVIYDWLVYFYLCSSVRICG